MRDFLKHVMDKDEGYELAMIGAKYGLDGDAPTLFLQELTGAYMKLKPCKKCGGTDLGHVVSDLPMNYLFCRKCGKEGKWTTDSFGDAEAGWNKNN